MILPDFILPSRINQCWEYSGLDSKHNGYPYSITYKYNSRGFRDTEWPADLTTPIWCIGDSFTAGIGCPLEHTWPYILGNTINVSMDGASNQWISRKAVRVLEEIQPQVMVIQWSFITRGENSDESLNDEGRRLHFYNLDATPTDLLKIFVTLVDQVEQHKKQTQVIHSFIPYWALGDHTVQQEWDRLRGPGWPTEPTLNLETFVQEELVNFGQYEFFNTYAQLLNQIKYVPEIVKLDLARDKFHYDKLTAQVFVNNIKKLLGKSV